MTHQQITNVVAKYGYTPHMIHPVQKGYRNESYAITVENGTTINLIIYKADADILERIHNAHYVAKALAGKGLPVRIPIDPHIICLRGERATKYAAIYNYLSGSTIPWEAYTMEHMKELGACLSTIHAQLAAVERRKLPNIIDELLSLVERMERYFSRMDVQGAIRGKLNLTVQISAVRYQQLLRILVAQPGAQPLHMDFVRGNVLFEDGTTKLSGILDFEKAAWGLPVFDVARTLAFLLVDCKYKTEMQVRKYFLHSGYNKRGFAQTRPGRVLEELTNLFLLHDLYKFLRHNPYESLQANEHYIRTRNLLLARHIISSK